MKKNKANQEFHVVAFDRTGRVSGDAANITCTLAIDGGARNATNDVSPTEIGTTGEYVFSLTQAETNGHQLSFSPVSSTAGVNVLGSPSNIIYTTEEIEILDKATNASESSEISANHLQSL